MEYRGVLAWVGGIALAGTTTFCSAADPGTLNFTERPRGPAGDLAGPGVDQGPGSDAGIAPDSTADAAEPVTAFTGAPAYMAGTAKGSSLKTGSHPNGTPAGNPAGLDCKTCHVAGGTAGDKVWGISGTVYNTVSGNAPVPQAEVRLVDATGKELAKVYSDALGNFWSNAITVPAGAKVGVRNATATKVMVAPLTTQDGGCQKAGCHAAPQRIFLQ